MAKSPFCFRLQAASITWNPQFWWSNPKFPWFFFHIFTWEFIHIMYHVDAEKSPWIFATLTSPFLWHHETWVGGWTLSCCRTLMACYRVCLPCVCWPMRSSTPRRPDLGRTWGWVRWRSRKVWVRFSHKIWGFSNPQKDFEESVTIKYVGRILP